jgi:putative transcriptional regulator
VTIGPGQLLVATPMIGDGNFDRGVVFVIEHTADGTLGVVLNRPTGQAVEVPGATWTATLGKPDVLFAGGPVSPETVLTLAHLKPGSEAPGWTHVWDRVVTLDPEAEIEDVIPHVAGARLFAGYAGWSPGQLNTEVDSGAWFVVDADPHDILSSQPEGLWEFVLRRQGGTAAWFVNHPDDPSFN